MTTPNSNQKQPHQPTLLPLECVSEWCGLTPAHCVNNVYHASSVWTRLAWLIIVLFAAFLAFYQTGMLFADYVGDGEGQWVTTISYELEDGGMEWPNLTICNYGIRFKTILKERNLTDPYEIAYEATRIDGTTTEEEAVEFYKEFQEAHPRPDETLEELLENTKRGVADKLEHIAGMSMTEILNAYGRRCNDTVIDCGLVSEFALHNRVECCDNATKMRARNCISIHPSMVFQKGRTKVSKYKCDSCESNINKPYPIADMGNDGIYYLFNPRINDYYNGLLLKNMPSAGLQIQMYFGTLEGATPELIYVAPGTHTLVQLTAEKRITLLDTHQMIPFYTPKKPCTEKFEYRHCDFPTYSQALCRTDCKVEWHMRECKCTILRSRLKDGRECIGDEIAECGRLERTWERNGSISNTTYEDGFSLQKCMEDCDEECELRNVQAHVSHATFPAPAKLKAFTTYMNKALKPADFNYTEEDAKQLILFEMFYQTVYYKVISKVEKTSIGTFISNIGGALGVWTGLSLLSIFQALVYFCMFMAKLWHRFYLRYLKAELPMGSQGSLHV